MSAPERKDVTVRVGISVYMTLTIAAGLISVGLNGVAAAIRALAEALK